MVGYGKKEVFFRVIHICSLCEELRGWDKRTEKAKAAWVMVAKSKPLKHLSTVGMTCIESALSAEHSAVPTLINARLPC